MIALKRRPPPSRQTVNSIETGRYDPSLLLFAEVGVGDAAFVVVARRS